MLLNEYVTQTQTALPTVDVSYQLLEVCRNSTKQLLTTHSETLTWFSMEYNVLWSAA